MRSFAALAPRQLRARRLRALLTAAGIVLGVAMILGVLLLSATIQRTFSDLFDSIYGRADLVVSGSQASGSLRTSTLHEVRRTEGVAEAVGNVQARFDLIEHTERPPPEPEPPAAAPEGAPPPGAEGTAPPPGAAKPEDEVTGEPLNVAGQDPGAADFSDTETVAGRKPRHGREIALQQSWADANKIEVGDRIRLATPSGTERLEVVGLFKFTTGLDFGGQGFATMPLGAAREIMDKPRGYDEVQLTVSGGEDTIQEVRRRLEHSLERGAKVATPDAKADEVESQLQAFNVILYFFAAMALFVGGFLIFNSFNMTVLQRIREIGMLRTLGSTRGMIVRSVLIEAALLGVAGTVIGLALGIALAKGLVVITREVLEVPVGELRFTWWALLAAVVTGVGTSVAGALWPARRAGRTSPIRAVLGTEGLRSRPRRRRAAIGVVLIVLGLGGAFWLGAADETTSIVAAAGMLGTIAIFFGIAMVSPFVIKPMVSVLSWPLRRVFGVEGRLAADAARSDPGRTAATATGLMIGLSLVVAVNSIGASFLSSIEDEFDRSFARDLTVQPRGFAPGQGPQQTIDRDLRDRLAKIPEAAVVARERFLFTPNLPGPSGKHGSEGLLFAFKPDEYDPVDQTDIEGASREQAFDRLERGWVTVGQGQADEAGLEVGDRIRLQGPSGSRHTHVAGIVQTVVFGGQTIGMSLDTLRDVWGVNADSELALKATSADARPILERKVERIVDRHYPNLAVLSNDELKSDVERRVNEQFAIFYAIVAVAVFASLFGIVNTLSMSVIERTREIGVLRALGANRWQVRRQVADESLVIGLIGAVLGIVVGAGLGWALLKGLAAGVPGVVYEPPLSTMALVAVAGMVLGLIASVLPARRAARLDVIRALSYE
ncbi:MAG TPA: FtsX-like permease family protein [Solirubrobacterales bacterium]|nr:FtsX-like permease family protein [Solirubrobacterales bacterium]